MADATILLTLPEEIAPAWLVGVDIRARGEVPEFTGKTWGEGEEEETEWDEEDEDEGWDEEEDEWEDDEEDDEDWEEEDWEGEEEE